MERLGKKSGVYKITNIQTGKCYVGSTLDLRVRKNNHKSSLRYGRHGNPILQEDYNTLGEECFIFEVVQIITRPDNCNDIEFKTILHQHEQVILDSLMKEGNCYNLAPDTSSTKNAKYSERAKQRMSQAAFNKAPMSLETREKLRQAMLKNGNKPPSTKGRKHTEEAKKKMSLAALGKKLSEETKEKLRVINTGKKLPPRTEEWSNKISAAKKGHNVSEETRQKISNTLKAKRGD